MKKVCIIGIGYVGLPLAILCSRKGHEVYGLDISKEKIGLINKGINPIDNSRIPYKIRATLNPSIIKECEIVVVCVPTPITKDKMPDLKLLINASNAIAKNLTQNKLIIIESTLNPSAIEKEVKPVLEKSNLVAGTDFYLAHCPERVDPGNKKWNVSNIPRVLGACSKKGLKKAHGFYRSILDAEITLMSDIKTTEAVKTVENAFRDVNIAFVNELAKSFDKLGIDLLEVINAASTKPFGFMPHYPGCGVGGHCIPVDPYYLIEKAKREGFNHQFLKLAREINNAMPHYAVSRVIKAINEIKKPVRGTKIGILGISYKGGIDDTRGSPAFEVIKELKELGAELLIYDPLVPDKSNVKDIKELLEKAECVVLVTDHREFKGIKFTKNIKAVIDGKNYFDKEKIKKLGIIYKGIGRE